MAVFILLGVPMFSPFSLPSDPGREIQLREATVAEAMEFAEVRPEHEEALTTRFLNTVQDPATFSDCRHWTGDDRRFALYWYSLHTLSDRLLSIPYECPHCNEPHVQNFDLNVLADTYEEIKGAAYRQVDDWRVIPLTGEALERLELKRLEQSSMTKDSPEYRRKAAEIRLETLVEQLQIPADLEAKPDQRRANVRTRLAGMTATAFEALQDQIEDAQDDMTHGLKSETVNGRLLLITPPHTCPTKGVATVLQLPFRSIDNIPRL